MWVQFAEVNDSPLGTLRFAILVICYCKKIHSWKRMSNHMLNLRIFLLRDRSKQEDPGDRNNPRHIPPSMFSDMIDPVCACLGG